MILKEKDSQDAELEQLEAAIVRTSNSSERRNLEKRLNIVRSGIAGEEEAAYHIDFYLKNNNNWAVIHDLRLEYNGRTAQIDHLLIDRFLEVYVLESKNFKTKVRFKNGGWERINGREWEGIPSPVEQNKRHIAVLKQLIEMEKLSPPRLGVAMSCTYENVVIVNPACTIDNSFPDEARVYQMDRLVSEIRKEDAAVLSVLKIISSETLVDFATKLIAHHRPVQRPQAVLENSPTKPEASHVCSGCNGPITKAEISFCEINKKNFAGALLCRKCQQYVPTPKNLAEKPELKCVGCGAAVDAKVKAFCWVKRKQFGGRILCRECQKKV